MKRFGKVLLALALAAGFLYVCVSGPLNEAPWEVVPFVGSVRYTLGGEKISARSESIRAVITADDIPALAHFRAVKELDLRGSACVEEIQAWAAAHPEVHVIYSVTLPNGQSVDSDAESADLSWLTDDQVDETAQQLAFLPNLRLLQLGTLDGVRLSLGRLGTLNEACPKADFDFSYAIGGEPVSSDSSSISLAGLKREDVPGAAVVLSTMKQLSFVDLGSADDENNELTWTDVALLMSSCPYARFAYSFTLYGQPLDLDAQELDFRGVEVDDDAAALFEILPCMKRVTRLDMDSTGVGDERMAQLRDSFPDIEVIWRIWFGDLYSVRTDAERVLASKPSVGGMIYDPSPLQYCTKMKYLDLGHNDDMTDLSFAANMPELEVLIIAMTGVTDISPLASCPKLEYLEINSTQIADLSPLENSAALRHLNIGCCPNITDITPLLGLTELERLWIGCETPVPAAQAAAMREAAPGCKVNTTTSDPHGEAWRFTRYDPEEPKYYWVPRHELLRNQLGYNYQEYSFYWLDPLCDLEAPAQYKGKFGKEVYGL